MKLIPLIAGVVSLLRIHARTAALASLALAAGISAPASLIFYMPQGGPMEYNYLGPVAVRFTLPEAIRIQRVSAWANGSEEYPTTISIRYGLASGFPSNGTVYSVPYHLSPVTNAPAAWQSVSSLKWDLQPDTYWLVLDGFGSYPLGYGYHGPHPQVTDIGLEEIALATRWGFEGPWEDLGYPFGLKIYAVPLSAVPEPATFGLFAALGLSAVAWRRRFKSREG